MSIDKLQLWRKGDKITANKLNDTLQAVNSLIELENDRLEQATVISSNESSPVQYNSVSLVENVPSWYQDVTPLWDQDGVTVIYDSWDGLGELTKEAGLYGRAVGVNSFTTGRSLTNNELTLIKPEDELKDGQQVVQVIQISQAGKITKNSIEVFDCVQKIPNNVLNPDGDSLFFRRLSRIALDNTHVASEDSTKSSPAWLLKSIATNDLQLPTFTISAVATNSDCNDNKDCKDCNNGSNDGSKANSNDDNNSDSNNTEGEEDCVLKSQVVQLLQGQGIFNKIKGLSNKGGLSLKDVGNVIEIENGIELYSSTIKDCGGTLSACFQCVNDSITPKPKKITLAEFPIKNTIYTYDKKKKDYVKNVSSDTSLKIIAEPIKCRAWQWGVSYGGQLDLESYKYLPSEDDNPDVMITGGEGIKVVKNGTNNYTINRNIYIKADCDNVGMCSACKNSIKITCYNCEGSVVYKIFSATNSTTSPSYEFDPEFFIVTDNSVSLNTAALYAIAEEVASEIEVEVQACGIVDTISSGKIKTTTQGLSIEGQQYTATTIASVVSC